MLYLKKACNDAMATKLVSPTGRLYHIVGEGKENGRYYGGNSLFLPGCDLATFFLRYGVSYWPNQ
jgi:hypothetical protein